MRRWRATRTPKPPVGALLPPVRGRQRQSGATELTDWPSSATNLARATWMSPKTARMLPTCPATATLPARSRTCLRPAASTGRLQVGRVAPLSARVPKSGFCHSPPSWCCVQRSERWPATSAGGRLAAAPLASSRPTPSQARKARRPQASRPPSVGGQTPRAGRSRLGVGLRGAPRGARSWNWKWRTWTRTRKRGTRRSQRL